MASDRDQLTLQPADLDRAAEKGIISGDQGQALWQFLTGRIEASASPSPRFDMAHLLWYVGALIIISAMGLFTTLAFAEWGGTALMITAIIYAVFFVGLGQFLWQRKLTTPGGLCIAVAVTMAPLFVFGLQDRLGWWTDRAPDDYREFYRWIKGSFLLMELATIAAGLVALAFFRFPFITAPIAVALWFMSMDLTPWIFGEDWAFPDRWRVVSLWFGLGMIALAWWVDVKARDGFAFWLHLFGLMAFWAGLSWSDSDSELSKALYCLINIGLLGLSVFLQRRAYAVFGAIGVAMYLSHLANHVFEDSLLYPFALSFVGLLILGAGIVNFRHRETIERWMRSHLPGPLQRLRPAHTAFKS
jgi:hypothetical protein